MKCETFIEKYTALDNLQGPGFAMRLHLFGCARCRKEAERLDAVCRRVKMMEPDLLHADLAARIMSGIRFSGVPYGKKVSMLNWVSAWSLLVASFFLVQFSEPRMWLGDQLGRGLEMALSVSLGVLITIFSAVLVGAHMKEVGNFKERVSLRLKK